MITKEMKDRIYHVYRVSYCEAVAEVMNGKAISEATRKRASKFWIFSAIKCRAVMSSPSQTFKSSFWIN